MNEKWLGVRYFEVQDKFLTTTILFSILFNSFLFYWFSFVSISVRFFFFLPN